MERILESDVAVLQVIYKQRDRVEVSKVRSRRTNQILCMKKLFVQDVNELMVINGEVISMASLDHPHILKLRGTHFAGHDNVVTHALLFMDYLEEGDLEKLILTRVNERKFWTEEELLVYFKQLVSACAYMQEKSIAHRDIKPQNIFVANGGRDLKLGDLGSAVKRDADAGGTLTGTPLYLSPKLRQAFANTALQANYPVNHDIYKSDVYSLGLTFLYMASLVDVKGLANLDNLQLKIDQRLNKLPPEYFKVKDLLSKMLITEEDLRLDFIKLEKFLNKNNSKIEVTDKNLNSLGPILINEFEAKCEVCKLPKYESELYILTSGLICNGCYQTVKSFLFPKTKL